MSPRVLLPGNTISARYELAGLVGRGGMAAVYRAYDATLNMEVALKVLTPQLAADPTFIARFRREGQTLAKLTHPNILRLYEIGEDSAADLYYLVLEYLTGGSLRDRYTRRHWSLTELETLLRPVASALDFAFRQNPPVVHRDLKPSNIMFADDGRPVVCDFGLAKLLEPEPGDDALRVSLTVNQILGTPAYMSPEQAAGLAVGPASDRYSLAVVAYELLTASVPFAADSARSTMRLVMDAPLPPPSTRNPVLGPGVDAVFERALAKRPEDRFATSRAFVDALVDAAKPVVEPLTELTLVQARSPHGSAAWKRTGSRRWWIGASIATALACAALPVIVLHSAEAPGQLSIPPTPAQAISLVVTPSGTEVPTPAATPTAPAPAATAQPTISPTARPTISPTAQPTTSPTDQPTPIPTPTVDQAWLPVLASLDLTWGHDWPASINAANSFLQDHPDFTPARDKLYAAYVLYADQLLADGQTQPAIEQLEAADNLAPERVEAHEALAALTPTPEPSPTPESTDPPVAPRPAPAQSQVRPPAPTVQTSTQQRAVQTGATARQDAAPSAPPAVAQTPTRIPFVPR
ncbi:MAG: protein kinase [Chloroflexi bacterium]|nr:protein kinase [Chloroflexota bacterium]